MNTEGTSRLSLIMNPPQIAQAAGWLALFATGATIALLVALHGLSPEFSPSWRVVSEYAFGHHAWVLLFSNVPVVGRGFVGVGGRHLARCRDKVWKGRVVVSDHRRHGRGDGLRL